MSKIEISPRKLPNTLSALIEVALEDLDRAEASRLYEVNMNQWHTPGGHEAGDKCEVCFAGGVIAFTLDGDIDRPLSPGSFDPATTRKLLALDNVRCGAVEAALENIGVDLPEGVGRYASIPGYRDNPVGFKESLHNLANELRAHSL